MPPSTVGSCIDRPLASTHETEEEVGWDEESDDENARTTPQIKEPAEKLVAQNTNESTTTIQPVPVATENLRPEGRRSHDEKSVADSDASYDLISGATSRAPGSPKDDKPKEMDKVEESDEEDWE